MVVVQNYNMPGVVFNKGYDVTSDLLNASEQYISTELTERTKDFIKYPGFAWGLHIGVINGQSILITSGVAFDQEGRRLYHLSDASYAVSFPSGGGTSGYLCMKKYFKNIAYSIHPYNGTRLPTESTIGIEFFVDTSYSIDIYGNKYPSNNDGMVIAKLEIVGASYDFTYDVRSPNLKLKDGTN